MDSSLKFHGWQIYNQEKLFFHSNSGTSELLLKFFHYPSYRQKVQIDKYPERCKLKIKGNNSFFIYQNQIASKGLISLDRIISVYPIPSFIDMNNDWGRISDFPGFLQRKYKQSSKYWPIKSTIANDIINEEWYKIDDLSCWVQSASKYITSVIKNREPQDKRLGADLAFNKGIGDCDEFTDLFITLARIRGIPSRRLTGYFISKKRKIVAESHAWGEILSPKKDWITIDIALRNIGNHWLNYVILKIEEFNPALYDYQIKTKKSSNVIYKWERPDPLIKPIF